jgi:photosystem II stability/assembly factor-like uncharacterized protein
MKRQLLVMACLTGISLGSMAQWTQQASGFLRVGTYPTDICIADSNNVWLVGANGDGSGVGSQEFSRTTDGGLNWTPGVVTSDTNYRFSNVAATNGMLAWATMYHSSTNQTGIVSRTTDGGTTWTPLSPSTIFNTAGESFPNFSYFWNDSMGFAQGDPAGGYFEIYLTSDSGSTWNRVPSANIPTPVAGEFGLVDCYSVIDSTIWWGTNKGRVFKSTDMGNTWTAALAATSVDMIGITFRDQMNGVCLKYNSTLLTYYIYRTTNGGSTWTQVNPTGPWFKSELYYVPGTNTLLTCGASTAGRGSAYSLDDGNTWTLIDTGATSIDGDGYTSLAFLNDHIGWAGGFTTDPITGGIAKWLGGPVGVAPVAPAVPYLSAYPNPGRDVVTLTMDMDKKTYAKIYVTDILGKLVYSNGELIGRAQLNHRINVSGWPAGVYIATIEWNGNKVQRKIVVE